MEYAFSPFNESAGDIICCWNSTLFVESDRTCNMRFVAVKGHWRSNDGLEGIISVYTPRERIDCFNTIVSFVQIWDCSDFVLFNDFNAMLLGLERWRINGCELASEELINLVGSLQLQDLPLSGALYSYFGNGQVVVCSRISQFLISSSSGSWSASCIQKAILRHVFYHIRILRTSGNFNVGPRSFKFFN